MTIKSVDTEIVGSEVETLKHSFEGQFLPITKDHDFLKEFFFFFDQPKKRELKRDGNAHQGRS